MSDDTLEPIDARTTALLIMDYQPAALQAVDDTAKLVENANAAIAVSRKHGGHVGFVRVALTDDDYSAVPPTNKRFSAVAARKALREGTPETVLHPDVAAHPGDLQVRKTRVGAFSTTNLDELLTNLGVTTLILAGVQTSGVVLSTVREAADRDYRLLLLSDCTADANLDVHDILINRVLPHHAEVVTSVDLARQFTAD
jgi:nicotinamidase-related amidase